jgi:hypothetical protein
VRCEVFQPSWPVGAAGALGGGTASCVVAGWGHCRQLEGVGGGARRNMVVGATRHMKEREQQPAQQPEV